MPIALLFSARDLEPWVRTHHCALCCFHNVARRPSQASVVSALVEFQCKVEAPTVVARSTPPQCQHQKIGVCDRTPCRQRPSWWTSDGPRPPCPSEGGHSWRCARGIGGRNGRDPDAEGQLASRSGRRSFASDSGESLLRLGFCWASRLSSPETVRPSSAEFKPEAGARAQPFCRHARRNFWSFGLAAWACVAQSQESICRAHTRIPPRLQYRRSRHPVVNCRGLGSAS